MNHKDQFDQIVNFLRPIKEMWFHEVINHFPDNLGVYNQDWIDYLADLPEEVLWKVDCHRDHSLISESELGRWMREIDELCQVEKLETRPKDSLPDWAFNKVKGKKRHEILTLGSILESIKEENDFSNLIDIGGGVGHLSRVLAHYYGIECISLDINQEFQDLGKKRLEKYPKPQNAAKVTFINHDFSNEIADQLNKEIFHPKSFSLGLHTCGPLANHHINMAMRNDTKGLINFGCCYNRLDLETDTNLSNYAREQNLSLSSYSLTLATRGHSSMELEDFRLKKRVKYFRYALQLYFNQYEGTKELVPVGEAHPRVYWGEFADYAIDKISKVGLTPKLSAKELSAYYNDEKTQEQLNQMFLANIIRWQLGRPLELYILLDRVLMIEEKGHSPGLKQVFDENLSPRNLAIILK